MAVSSSGVEIRINVVDGNTSEVVSSVTKNLEQLGQAGQRAGSVGGKGIEQIGEHSLSSLDKVRLLRDDLGIRLPRSIEKLISQSEVAMTVIGGLGTALAGLGFIEIGITVGKGLVDAYERISDVNKAMREFAVTSQQTADQKLIDTSSLETASSILRQIDQQIDSLQNKRRASGVGADNSGSIKQWFAFSEANGDVDSEQPIWSSADDEAEAKLRKDRESVQDRKRELLQQRAVQDLQRQSENAVKGQSPAAVPGIRLGYSNRIAQLQQQQQRDNELFQESRATEAQKLYIAQHGGAGKVSQDDLEKAGLVYHPSNSSADAQYQQQLKNNREAASAENRELKRAETSEITRLNDEQAQSSIKGIALIRAQQRAAENTYIQEHGRNTDVISAIDAKYQAQISERIKDLAEERARYDRQAQYAGLHGVARTIAEGQAQQQDISDRGLTDPNDLAVNAAHRNQIAAATGASVEDQQRSFREEIDRIAEESADHSTQGFGRIHADAQKQRTDLQRRFDDSYSGIDLTVPGAQKTYDAATSQLGRGQTAITGSENSQAAELARKNAQETEQIEAQARAKSLSDERQQTAAIQTEYDERVRKWQEALNDQEISSEDFNRRQVAAAQERDAEIAQNEKQQRDKLAGELQGLFSNPRRWAINLGDKAMAQVSAASIQSLQKRIPGAQHALDFSDPSTWIDHIGFRKKQQQNTLPLSPIIRYEANQANSPASGAAAEFDRIPGVSLLSGSSKLATVDMMTVNAQSVMIGGAGSAIAGISNTSGSFPNLEDKGSQLAPASFASPLMEPGGMPRITAASYGSQQQASGLAGTVAGSIGNGYRDGGSSRGSSSGVLGGINKGFQTASGLSKLLGSKGKSSALAGKASNEISQIDTSSQISDVYLDENGNAVHTGSTQNSAGTGGINSTLGTGMGIASSGLGVFGAIESTGGASGAVGGALSGSQLGSKLGSFIPGGSLLGAGIGAIAGAVLGFMGFGGRSEAENYFKKQVKPRIADDQTAYGAGEMDYLSAFNDIQQLEISAKTTTNQMGHGGSSYYQDTIKPALNEAKNQLTREEKAGRSQYTMSGAQAHQGGFLGNFGNMSTSDNEGWVHAMADEFVVQEQPALEHSAALQAINAGASHADMARYYGGGSGSSTMMPDSSGDVHLHVHAIDAKSSMQFLMDNKHSIRSALNASYAENSGGSDA